VQRGCCAPGWMAQELLQTFSTILRSALDSRYRGVFEIRIDGAAPLGSESATAGFRDPKELKQRVRDLIDPGRDLGHADRQKTATEDEG